MFINTLKIGIVSFVFRFVKQIYA